MGNGKFCKDIEFQNLQIILHILESFSDDNDIRADSWLKNEMIFLPK